MKKLLGNEESVPFYKQLKDKIIEDIEIGKLKHGDKLPSERDLAAQYGISRMTARHTLSALEREGLVERRVGAGSFVSNNKIQMDFITFNSFTNDMLGKGLTPSTQVLSIGHLKATPFLAEKLQLPEGEELFTVKRLRLVNDRPIAIEESFIPEQYCQNIKDFITNDISLYNVLENEFGIKLVKAKEFMRVTFSDENESKLLKIRSESPCIFREAVAFDRNDKEIEFSTSLTRSDIVKFYSELNLK
ncbi:GntR family transcriptional regulator [Metabacillus litoralis]|uniref:GntR family transcriptional regulator n=1 Tax=Metabacillus TaxID=2675233 RepID=UPI001BA017E2|nr:GntR family transcriptional regulator [Metabacillus litoralis]MCM3163211.1 GntR family transcriptional regulator [Metabacillus litoralis]MCM3409622.1 GntR family transcriptional regulator [Metabacillus litoralis]UHA58803.1 GntR family transcriptional regulator [Metabacillus litoralis]